MRSPIGLILMTCLHNTSGFRAVAKRRDAHWNKTSECLQSTTEGIAKQQRSICASNLDLMPTVAYSARQMAQVCQETFYDSRWNCSSVLLAPNFNPDLNGGSREQAFAYALASASLTQSVSKACSAGTTMRCSCGGVPREPANPIVSIDRPDEQFQWGGCSDDVKFGLEFSQAFVEAAISAGKPSKSSGNKAKSKPSKKTLMNHHNYRVGRKNLDIVVDRIGKEIESLTVDNRNRSSSYRECNKSDDAGSASCRSMCCGRGYNSQIVEIQYRCECKYFWCCYVKCKICSQEVEVSRCR